MTLFITMPGDRSVGMPACQLELTGDLGLENEPELMKALKTGLRELFAEIMDDSGTYVETPEDIARGETWTPEPEEDTQ